MKLNEYIAEECKLLNKFEVWWTKQNLLRPKDYPLQMEAEQWLNEFNSWMLATAKDI